MLAKAETSPTNHPNSDISAAGRFAGWRVSMVQVHVIRHKVLVEG